MLERILVPLDGSPFAESAIPAAVAIAERVGGEVRFLSVRPHLWSDDAAALERALDQETWAYLADVTTRTRAMTTAPGSCSRKGTAHCRWQVVAPRGARGLEGYGAEGLKG